MIMKTAISNKAHPEYGQATIPFPIPDSEYDHTIGLLEAMDIGSPTAQDCRVDGLDSKHPILNRLVTQSVNVDELDHLAKRVASFCQGEDTAKTWTTRRVALTRSPRCAHRSCLTTPSPPCASSTRAGSCTPCSMTASG